MLEKHVEEIIAQHGVWLNSKGKDGRRASFEDADLRLVDLSGVNLARANLRGACVDRADLSGAVLRDADLSGASLDYAQLLGTDFTKARLHETSLNYALLKGATFTGANLVSATAHFADFSGAAFSKAQLRNVSFENAKLIGCDLTEAMLMNANLDAVDFTDANVDHADFQNAKLRKSKLFFGSRRDTNFEMAVLKDAIIDTDDLDLLEGSLSPKGIYLSEERGEKDEIEKSIEDIQSSRDSLLGVLETIRRIASYVLYFFIVIFALLVVADLYTSITGGDTRIQSMFTYTGSLILAASAAFVTACTAFLTMRIKQAATQEAIVFQSENDAHQKSQGMSSDAGSSKTRGVVSASPSARKSGGK